MRFVGISSPASNARRIPFGREKLSERSDNPWIPHTGSIEAKAEFCSQGSLAGRFQVPMLNRDEWDTISITSLHSTYPAAICRFPLSPLLQFTVPFVPFLRKVRNTNKNPGRTRDELQGKRDTNHTIWDASSGWLTMCPSAIQERKLSHFLRSPSRFTPHRPISVPFGSNSEGKVRVLGC